MTRHSSQPRGGNRMQQEGGNSPERGRVNKGKAAKSFGNEISHTKAINTAAAPMRGGIRL